MTLAVSVTVPRHDSCRAVMPPRPHTGLLTSRQWPAEGPWSPLRLPNEVQGLEVHPG